MTKESLLNPEFDDIRCFNDNEIKYVIKKLKHNRRFSKFIKHLASRNLKGYKKLFYKIIFPVVWHRFFRKNLTEIDTVIQLQSFTQKIIAKFIDSIQLNITYGGLENIDKNNGCLFISNHRDITLDATVLSYILHSNGINTTYNAAGDNLMEETFIKLLLKANKTFIVRRSLNMRETLVNAKLLSKYIYLLREQKSNIWLAQRAGRAKNGADLTDLKVIKMLLLNKPKSVTISDYANKLNIMPMAISYQWDPCDIDKAKEIEAIEKDANYTKPGGADFDAICKGIFGNKGNVHIQFGKPLTAINFDSAEQITKKIDDDISNLYNPFDSNYAAYKLLGNDISNVGIDKSKLDAAEEYLKQKIENLNPTQVQHLLKAYAQPIIAKL